MTIRKTTNGRFQAIVKSGRTQVASRTFDLKRDADQWHAMQVRALDLGQFVDPRAGRETLGSVIDRWMQERQGTVSSTTFKGDTDRVKYVAGLASRPVSSITAADLTSLFASLTQRGLSVSTVNQVRILLSGALGWAASKKIILTNPVRETKRPKDDGTKRHERRPLSEAELRALVAGLRIKGGKQADIALVLGLTGLRWGELVALRVRDVSQVPPAFRVSRSASDGHAVRSTKNGRTRTVNLAPEVAEIVAQWSEGKDADDFLFTSPTGKRLSETNWRRITEWSKHCDGHTVHELRHTAATLWINAGVPVKTAQAWLGHQTLQMTTDLYGHGPTDDAAALAMARFAETLSLDEIRGAPGVLDTVPENRV